MPQIQQYTPQTDAPGPVGIPSQEGGEAFGAIAAQQLRGTAQDIGQAGEKVEGLSRVLQEREAESDTSQLSVQLAQVRSQYTQKFQQMMLNGDPNDPNLVSNFMDDYRDAVSSVRNNIKTRGGENWFNKVAAEQEEHFSDTAAAGQITLAGVQAKQNFQALLSTQQSTLGRDPGSYQSVKSEVMNTIAGYSSLSQEERYKLEQHAKLELAEAAARGEIMANPRKAMEELELGKWDSEVTPQQRDILIDHAHRVISGRNADAEAALRMQERAIALRADKSMSGYLARIDGNTRAEPTDQYGKMVTSDEILNNKDLTFEQQTRALNMLKGATEGTDKIPDNPVLFGQVLSRITAPPGTPNKIINDSQIYALAEPGPDGELPKLPYSQVKELLGEYHSRTSDDGRQKKEEEDHFFASVKGLITKSDLQKMDREGDYRYNNYWREATGILRQADANNEPRGPYFDPDSPKYLGKLALQPRYQPTPQDILNKMVARWGGQPAKDNTVPYGPPEPKAPAGAKTQAPPPEAKKSSVDVNDPKVKAALKNGYSIKQIEDYLNARRK